MKCDMCETAFEAEDFNGWIEKMKGHYTEAHKDVMKSEDTGSEEENMAKMKKWMDDAKTRWEALPEA